jgi:hypothetical protein
VVEEIIGRLPDLTGVQLGRLEDEIRREHKRRASSAGDGGQDAPRIQKGATPSVTEVLQYRPHEDSYLQLELRRDGSVATARPASADRTGTSSTTRAVSARSSISARPATRRVRWP